VGCAVGLAVGLGVGDTVGIGVGDAAGPPVELEPLLELPLRFPAAVSFWEQFVKVANTKAAKTKRK
jgi:hypothetical protein